MKKNILSIIALICAAVSLAVSLLSFVGSPNAPVDYSARLQELADQNKALQAQLDALSAQLANTPRREGLADWSLTAAAWESREGASVTLFATPDEIAEGMTASFSVRLEGQEMVNIPCDLEDQTFTATADLSAADGYSFYCILTDAQGKKQQFALSTPENPVEDIPVYLETSLSAYCNLIVDSWLDTEEAVTITAGYVQVQLPRLSLSDSLAAENAELVLLRNDQELHRQEVALEAGEGDRSLEAKLTDTKLPLPAMENDDYLDLRLEVTLSDGTVLSTSGASWFKTAEGLFLVVG